MKKKERKQRLALTLLLSIFVFAINTVALILAIAAMYLMTRLGIIEVTGGQVQLRHVLRFIFYTSIAIGFLITAFAGKLPLKPFNLIINKLDSLAKGDFKARLHFKKPFCDQRAFKQVEQSFNRAAEELEHTEMLRNEFINNFSHEFKTPIVSIAGFAKLLRRGNLTDEEKDEYLAVIEEESLRLSDMANNVLSLTRVENQTILTDISEFNLSEQIRGALLLLEEKWTAKNLYMDLQFGEYIIQANEELLKQVWINLLDNAIKFSETNGKVTVAIKKTGDSISVAISNYGKDIPKESLDHIFNKFYQADKSHSSEGNGIGLAIVKKVCELHSGEVYAESENGTTTFTVLLPVCQA